MKAAVLIDPCVNSDSVARSLEPRINEREEVYGVKYIAPLVSDWKTLFYEACNFFFRAGIDATPDHAHGLILSGEEKRFVLQVNNVGGELEFSANEGFLPHEFDLILVDLKHEQSE